MLNTYKSRLQHKILLDKTKGVRDFPGGPVAKTLGSQCRGPGLISQWVRSPPANAEDTGDVGSIPGLGRCPGEGNGYPLQYSCLENAMNRGAW